MADAHIELRWRAQKVQRTNDLLKIIAASLRVPTQWLISNPVCAQRVQRTENVCENLHNRLHQSFASTPLEPHGANLICVSAMAIACQHLCDMMTSVCVVRFLMVSGFYRSQALLIRYRKKMAHGLRSKITKTRTAVLGGF